MLAARRADPFIDPEWMFELKWDGVRAVLYSEDETPTLRSRSGHDITARYPELSEFRSDRPVVLDGEIVALDDEGRPSFERLQQRMNLSGAREIATAVGSVPISYVAFDVLYDDADVTGEPWEQRRARLDRLGLQPPFVASTAVSGDPTALWALVVERAMEGIMAKRRTSIYRPGARSQDWLKITRFRQVRAVVGGYLPGEGGRAGTFGSLLLGLWEAGALRWVGSVGSGFGDAALAAIRETLDVLTIEESPFCSSADLPGNAVWVEPRLVALVQYKEFTGAGRLRAPSFKGFTDDDLATVTWENEGPSARS